MRTEAARYIRDYARTGAKIVDTLRGPATDSFAMRIITPVAFCPD